MSADTTAIAIFFGMLGGYWVLVFLFALLSNCSCFQVRERQASVRETCGRQGQQLTPGWYCLCPIMHQRRVYEYKYYVTNGYNNAIQEIKSKQLIIPLQQQSLDYPAFEVITRDNVQCYLDLTVTYSITNAVQMLYSVTNLPYMIEKIINALVRQRAGQLDLDRIIEDPSQISRLQVPLQEEVKRWGVAIHLLKVQKVEATDRLKDALSLAKKTELDNQVKLKQVSTDRHTSIIHAQGERDRLIKEAEGKAQQTILQGKGRAEQIRNQARAEAEAIKQLAQRGMGTEAAHFTLKNKYIEVLDKIVKAASETGYYSHDGDVAEVAKMMGVTVSLK
ncbi:Band_7 protein [Hexamita inflata]|uniref:Band 7 protein n=1 Tax=Hexamita inflata TaxID=28002 RepID=A0AA86NDK1_9EUKA|nr:Band 7 protein [Hexamita inflata]CAI9917084.1 Band 7 protein [Hexamita inflata]CAI9964229.1 Band 7 protein [Hexamita inflata]